MVNLAFPRRGEIHLVSLDPTRGAEIRKTRPCLVVSPDELNAYLKTVIIAPMTTAGRAYPFRIACTFRKKAGYIVLDQLRTVDNERLIRRMGKLHTATFEKVLDRLRKMFEP